MRHIAQPLGSSPAARRDGRVEAWQRWTRTLRWCHAALLGLPGASQGEPRLAALYPKDGRRDLTGADLDRYKGRRLLWCRRPDGVPRRAAAAWLIADPTVVVAQRPQFPDRRLETTRQSRTATSRSQPPITSSWPTVSGSAPPRAPPPCTSPTTGRSCALPTPADATPQPLPQSPTYPSATSRCP